ncbi:Sec-independent protein translocase protein TatB [Methylobacterium organophilum]|uniref:Sec-independent protein translocase protein TatB n=1 Tax=Methylobacterium organophilum TaxID=410 RepID=UPI001F1397B5|nr:Sec-independent protein translocase protein TatB [Methylobacterium organophilum]UMY16629.1 Sec-independent protein translocase protein TatB [Methylobacterium organophilum]
MLDMSWGEVMLIGGVALIVIGPKDLPKALRTLGQVTTKVRRMAAEFQGQFNEAIREAELDEIRRDVEGVKRSVDSYRPNFNPVETIRSEIKNAVEGRSGKAEAPAAGSYDVPRPEEAAPAAPEPAAEPVPAAKKSWTGAVVTELPKTDPNSAGEAP